QICTPSYTVDVAAALVPLVQTAPPGLYHVTNAGQTSWYEFAKAIFEIAGVKADLRAITSRDLALAARRPAYSVLDNGASAKLGLPPLRPWREALAAYSAQGS